MLSRIWILSGRKEFGEKLLKTTGGAFVNFPRFAPAHCSLALPKAQNRQWSFKYVFRKAF